MYKMTSFNGAGLDTSAADNLSYLFYGCTNLRELEGVSNWNTSRMETMDKAFANCVSLRTLDLSGWDTNGQSSLGFFAMFENSFENVSLETFLVGENYRMWGQGWMPNAPTASGWWSTSDGTWYTKDDVVNNRSGIADTYTSTVRKSINSRDVRFGITGSHVYTGAGVRPSVELWDRGYQLREGLDYVASYRDNVNVGMATVVVRGIDAYVGTRESTFQIVPASLGSAQVTGVAGWTYDGKVHAVAPKVVLGGVKLVAGVDYALVGASARDAGVYRVTVRGKGNYTGTATASFSVAKAANGMTTKASKKEVKASKVRKKNQAVSQLKVTGAAGGVTYMRVSKGSSKCLSVNKKNGKVTAAGDANHKPATKTVTCKVVVK